MVSTELIIPKHDEEKQTLILEIDPQLVAASIARFASKATSKGFMGKTEFHITIVGKRIGRMINRAYINKLGSGVSNDKLRAEVERLIEETDWSEGLTLLPDYYQIHEDEVTDDNTVEHKESIIQLVSLPAATGFLNKLAEIMSLSLEEPFPHVTLYTKGDGPNHRLGIGIISPREFEATDHRKLESEDDIQ